MRKWGLGIIVLVIAQIGQAATPLPDNMYFKAMQDEMKRSMDKLRQPGVEKPYFLAYKLVKDSQFPEVMASFGALYPLTQMDDTLNAFVWMDIGNAQKDSLGHLHDVAYADRAYRPRQDRVLAKSYPGIRRSLWLLTDQAYTFAAETYQQKQAYEQTKQMQTDEKLPDVLPAKQASYVEEISPATPYDMEVLKKWVKEQSALGKQYPFLEQFTISIMPKRRDTYYLNSWGGFYQKSVSTVRIAWLARFRDKDGYERRHEEVMWTTDFSKKVQEKASAYTLSFLETVQDLQNAVAGEYYVGPVLLFSAAAGGFLNDTLVTNFQNLKTFTSNQHTDKNGQFDEPGRRVMAPGITVWDLPYQHSIGGFMPVDDEGVAAQDLMLVEDGYVVEIPRTMRPLSDKQLSNGHARSSAKSMPREQLTNVYIEPQNPLDLEALFHQITDRAIELGLPYVYFIYQWPQADNDNTLIAQRMYVDGRPSEMVRDMQVEGLTTRALRDIIATGEMSDMFYVNGNNSSLPTQTITTPVLMLEELELSPSEKKPDKKPFVPKP